MALSAHFARSRFLRKFLASRHNDRDLKRSLCQRHPHYEEHFKEWTDEQLETLIDQAEHRARYLSHQEIALPLDEEFTPKPEPKKFVFGRRTRRERELKLTGSAIWLFEKRIRPTLYKTDGAPFRLNLPKIAKSPRSPQIRALREGLKRLKNAADALDLHFEVMSQQSKHHAWQIVVCRKSWLTQQPNTDGQLLFFFEDKRQDEKAADYLRKRSGRIRHRRECLTGHDWEPSLNAKNWHRQKFQNSPYHAESADSAPMYLINSHQTDNFTSQSHQNIQSRPLRGDENSFAAGKNNSEGLKPGMDEELRGRRQAALTGYCVSEAFSRLPEGLRDLWDKPRVWAQFHRHLFQEIHDKNVILTEWENVVQFAAALPVTPADIGLLLASLQVRLTSYGSTESRLQDLKDESWIKRQPEWFADALTLINELQHPEIAAQTAVVKILRDRLIHNRKAWLHVCLNTTKDQRRVAFKSTYQSTNKLKYL